MRVRDLFFLSIVGVIGFGFSPSSWAFQAKPCVQLLSADSKQVSEQSLSESPLGAQIYKELRQLVSVHPDTYAVLRKQATKEHFKYKDLLTYIREDRARVLAGLAILVAKSETDPVIKNMVAHTMSLIETDERRDETDDQSVQRLMLICGTECGADISTWFKNENLRKEIEGFAQQYYAKNYSFISELLTALEVKGFVGIGFHLRDLFSPADQKKLLSVLKSKGLENLANLEIDVGAKDSANNLMTWFEVKHVSRRIEEKATWWMDKIKNRIKMLQKFIDVVESDPELSKAWPYKTDFRFIIRGAGISGEARELLITSSGIVVYDRELSDYNKSFGKK